MLFTLDNNRNFAFESLSILRSCVAYVSLVKQDANLVVENSVNHVGIEHKEVYKLAHNISQQFKINEQLTSKLGQNVLYSSKKS